MSLEVDYHPMASLDAVIPCFRKVVKGFRDNGDYSLILHLYNGGLRAPRIFDVGDKREVKEALADFLRVWEKQRYTGQIVFHLKHGELKDDFDAYPGSGSFNEYQKEGIKFQVSRYQHGYNDNDPWFYGIANKGEIARKAEEDVPF